MTLWAIDSETARVGPLDKAPPLVCVSYAGEDGSTGLLRWDEAKPFVAKVLTHGTAVAHNAAFDMAVFARQWPDLIPLIFRAYSEDRIRCTHIESKLESLANGGGLLRPFGLATLVKERFSVELDKHTYRLDYADLRTVPVDQWAPGARQYAIDDAVWCLRLAQSVDGGPDRYRQARSGFAANLMGVWGVQTDSRAVASLKADLIRRRDAALHILVAAGVVRGSRKKDGSKEYTQDTKKTRELMIRASERTGMRLSMTAPSSRFPNGQVQIAAEQCEDSGDPILEAVAAYGSIRKMLSTDIPNLERGEIHTRYDSLKETGRVGSGGKDDTSPTGTAFNLTNLAKEGGVRECFISRTGVLAGADYDALEGKTFAQVLLSLIGKSEIARIMQDPNQDWHIHTAAAFLGIPYEEGMARKLAGDKSDPIHDARQLSKIVNYGNGGGMGPTTQYSHLQKQLKAAGLRDLAAKLTRSESDKLHATWRQRYPEVNHYFRRNGDLIKGGRYQMEALVSGRKRMIQGPGAYSTLCNSYFQCLGADVAKAAWWEFTRDCYDPSRNSIAFGSRPVLFTHDSLDVEVPPEIAHEVAFHLKKTMEQVSSEWCPDVPLTTTPTLSSCLSKNAKTIIDEHTGRLQVWSPKKKAL